MRADIRLGDRVRITEAKDITGRVISVTSHLDGTTTLGVEFWNNGSREAIACRADELELLR